MNKILLFLLFGILSSAAVAQKDTVVGEKVYTVVQMSPSFPGGSEAFCRFINNTIRYPVEAREHGTQGKVIVSFIVEKDGTLTNFSLRKNIEDGLGEEAIRVMKLSPKWKPGKQDDSPVRVAFNVPVSFALSN